MRVIKTNTCHFSVFTAFENCIVSLDMRLLLVFEIKSNHTVKNSEHETMGTEIFICIKRFPLKKILSMRFFLCHSSFFVGNKKVTFKNFEY